MKFKLLWLIAFFFIYDFINEPLKSLIMGGSKMNDYFDWLDGGANLLYSLTGNFSMFLYALIVYTGFYYFFPKRNYLLCFATIVLAFTAPIFVRYFLEQVFSDYVFGMTNYRKGIHWADYARDNYYYAFRFVSFGLVYYLIRYAFFKESQQKQLAIENQKMELSLLRSQINPHFLLNSMNNIYSLVYQESDKSLDAIDTLSGFLKYSLYEQKEMVTVEEEVKNVQKIIDLNKLRFDYDLPIELNVDSDITEFKIPPFTIIPLVENAFKHGDLKDNNFPLKINIDKANNDVRILVNNKKGKHLKDEVGGIGLENIKKRLELIYPNSHTFKINDTNNQFEVLIKIPTK